MDAAAKVKAWVNENFTDDVIMEPWPLLPGGVIVRDQDGGERRAVRLLGYAH